MKMVVLAKAVAPKCKIKYIGIRPGEKINECLLIEDEAINSLELDNYFVIKPQHSFWKDENHNKGKALSNSFRYASDSNAEWLTNE